MVFPDLFINDTIRLATGLKLCKYVCAARENWDNYKPENEFVAGNEEDKELENIERFLGNQYALYSVYN